VWIRPTYIPSLKYEWLGQSIGLIALLGQIFEEQFIILGKNVNPYAQKAPSKKSTTFYASSNLKYIS
jgi:hypothetical protein